MPAATLELVPSREGQFRIGYASGAKNGAIDPAYTNAIRDYLNQRSAVISSPGSNLADNAGIFDSTSPAEFKRAAREAGLTEKQVKATDWYDLPRFVTVDDVKAAAKGTTSTEVAVVNQAPGVPIPEMDAQELLMAHGDRMTERQRGWLREFSRRWEEAPDTPQGERILDAMTEEYAAWRQNNRLGPDQQAPAPARGQGLLVSIPEDLEARELLDGYSDRLFPEQTRWLEDWSERFESASGGARRMEDMDNPDAAMDLLDEYEGWRENNRMRPDPLENLFDDLEPDPTAVANQGAGLPLAAQDVYDLAGQYDVPPAMIRNIVAEVNGPVERAFELQNEAFTGAGRFATLQEASRTGAVRLIGDLLNERAQGIRNERQQAQPGQAYDPRDLAMARDLLDIERDPDGSIRQGGIDSTAYALQTGQLDHPLINHIPPGPERAARLEPVLRAFVEQVANERQQAQLPAPVEPQPAVQVAQRDPVPRSIQTMATGDLINNMSQVWNTRAQTLAETYFNDNVIDGPNISIGSLTGMLRDYRIGPHAEAPAEVRELAARRLENLHTEAEGNAEQVADALNEAFYMDMDPLDAGVAIVRDINALERNGENFWEDLVGPMAEDIPWSRNVQQQLIGYLRALMDQYTDMGPDGYAKGGMVKKKHMAKKDGMPLILTRKSPELTELAYQYGGIVG